MIDECTHPTRHNRIENTRGRGTYQSRGTANNYGTRDNNPRRFNNNNFQDRGFGNRGDINRENFNDKSPANNYKVEDPSSQREGDRRSNFLQSKGNRGSDEFQQREDRSGYQSNNYGRGNWDNNNNNSLDQDSWSKNNSSGWDNSFDNKNNWHSRFNNESLSREAFYNRSNDDFNSDNRHRPFNNRTSLRQDDYSGFKADYKSSNGNERDYNFRSYNKNNYSPNENQLCPDLDKISHSVPRGGWAASKARYEWEEDQIFDATCIPKSNVDLEMELFNDQACVSSGINFKKYKDLEIQIKGTHPPPIFSFDECSLHPVLMENIKLSRYMEPTPVQSYAIPAVMEGLDLMACAQTGSGKTAAFLLPLISNLINGPKSTINRNIPSPRVLIIAPTRELASQIFDEAVKFCYKTPFRPCLVYGGAHAFPQLSQLRKGCDILVATPGRLKDMAERKQLSLGFVKYLVMDEADRQLDMGFQREIEIILDQVPKASERQTLFFSATFPKAIRRLAIEYMRKYLFLAVGRIGGTTDNITQKVIQVDYHDKFDKLLQVLDTSEKGRTLIFCNKKRDADTLNRRLEDRGIPTTSIHGERSQAEREDALMAFRKLVKPVLVATNVAARGLDIKDVIHVINYDLPSEIGEYVHRIGRTARAGNGGLATSFYGRDDFSLSEELAKILKECNQKIPDFLQRYVPQNMIFDRIDDDEQLTPTGRLPNIDSTSERNKKFRNNNPDALSSGHKDYAKDNDDWKLPSNYNPRNSANFEKKNDNWNGNSNNNLKEDSWNDKFPNSNHSNVDNWSKPSNSNYQNLHNRGDKSLNLNDRDFKYEENTNNFRSPRNSVNLDKKTDSWNHNSNDIRKDDNWGNFSNSNDANAKPQGNNSMQFISQNSNDRYGNLNDKMKDLKVREDQSIGWGGEPLKSSELEWGQVSSNSKNSWD